jgi:hypothetical protein
MPLPPVTTVKPGIIIRDRVSANSDSVPVNGGRMGLQSLYGRQNQEIRRRMEERIDAPAVSSLQDEGH